MRVCLPACLLACMDVVMYVIMYVYMFMGVLIFFIHVRMEEFLFVLVCLFRIFFLNFSVILFRIFKYTSIISAWH